MSVNTEGSTLRRLLMDNAETLFPCKTKVQVDAMINVIVATAEVEERVHGEYLAELRRHENIDYRHTYPVFCMDATAEAAMKIPHGRRGPQPKGPRPRNKRW